MHQNMSNNKINQIKRYKIENLIFYFILFGAYVLLFYLAAQNLSYNFFWFDESGQFFISQGLNHDSVPYSMRGDINDVINSNAHYNMDPGGYTLLLYFWTGISDNGIWLRSLGYIFMSIAVLFSIFTTYKILHSKKISAISGLLIFSLFSGSQFFELRAYSMELCGTVIGIWAIIWCKESLNLKKIIICTCIFVFFATSRYTMLVLSWLYCGIIILMTIRSKEKVCNKIIFSIILIMGLLICSLYIYIHATSIQNNNFSSLSYIQYWPAKKQLLLLFVFLCFTLITFKRQNTKVKYLISIFWIVNFCFSILGYLKCLPWCFWGNKGGPFIWLAEYTMFITILGLLVNSTKRIQKVYIPSLLITMTFTFFVVKITGGSGLRLRTNNYVENIEYYLKDKNDTVFVNRFGCPEVRFYFEHGSLKNKAHALGYPERFKFLNGIPHNLTRAKELEINRDKRKKDFFENMPLNAIMLGNYLDTEDSTYITNFRLKAPYINTKIK